MELTESASVAARVKGRATWRDYVALARPDHWVKHVFIVPGVALASVLHERPVWELWPTLVLGFLSAAAIASANYVLNEWLDAEQDAFHPTKSDRPAVSKALAPGLVWFEYLVLAAVGLVLGLAVSKLLFWVSLVFLSSGVTYNVRPLRTKDRPYLDVASEALNNPIRLTLGWAMIDSTTLPPSSLLAAYWMGGAFLMAMKRFAEYRTAADTGHLDSLGLYRRSFRSYSQRSLLLSSFLYAQMAAFFLAVFLIKYRIEYLLSMPLFAALFVSYLKIALRKESPAQAPERLFRETPLLVLAALLAVLLVVLTKVDLPFLERLADPHFIRFSAAGE